MAGLGPSIDNLRAQFDAASSETQDPNAIRELIYNTDRELSRRWATATPAERSSLYRQVDLVRRHIVGHTPPPPQPEPMPSTPSPAPPASKVADMQTKTPMPLWKKNRFLLPLLIASLIVGVLLLATDDQNSEPLSSSAATPPAGTPAVPPLTTPFIPPADTTAAPTAPDAVLEVGLRAVGELTDADQTALIQGVSVMGETQVERAQELFCEEASTSETTVEFLETLPLIENQTLFDWIPKPVFEEPLISLGVWARVNTTIACPADATRLGLYLPVDNLQRSFPSAGIPSPISDIKFELLGHLAGFPSFPPQVIEDLSVLTRDLPDGNIDEIGAVICQTLAGTTPSDVTRNLTDDANAFLLQWATSTNFGDDFTNHLIVWTWANILTHCPEIEGVFTGDIVPPTTAPQTTLPPPATNPPPTTVPPTTTTIAEGTPQWRQFQVEETLRLAVDQPNAEELLAVVETLPPFIVERMGQAMCLTVLDVTLDDYIAVAGDRIAEVAGEQSLANPETGSLSIAVFPPIYCPNIPSR